eukprot:gb/GFBE01055840.1/.p1 GENE.gb/GFBE01055840.1/~~gb/GFBE01055840.1/.p1  ORF type:complete len:397 (+),score=97.95 gb/GFBE01055840.1/:1-1191(+)
MAKQQLHSMFFGLACLAIHQIQARQMEKTEGFDSVVSVQPSSITVNYATEVTFQGAGEEDKVQFAADCQSITTPSATVRGGKAAIMMTSEGIGLKLCYQEAGKVTVEEQRDILFNVVAATDAGAIEGISPATVNQGSATQVTLTGAKKDGKAVFIPAGESCSAATPSTPVDGMGVGVFTVTGVGGKYKLCYQAPGGSDSIEQTPLTGSIVLEVIQTTKTKDDKITAVSPTLITENVASSIAFTGASVGDKATFVPKASNCGDVVPDKDVGVGHNAFKLSPTGDFKLCLTAQGASDSVEQTGITLTVRPPGVAQNMLGRWTSKNGQLSCDNLKQVPYCSASGIYDCENTYAIQSGIGYKCFWNTAIWPPACDVDMKGATKEQICKSNTCGGSPSQCW